eukprot:4961046-Prymnesium_polylepis.1
MALTAEMCITEPTLKALAAAIDASRASSASRSKSSYFGGKAALALLLGSFSTVSGQTAALCNSSAPVRSAGWSFTSHGSYKIVTVTGCSASYVLYDRGTTMPSLGTSYTYFAVPLLKAVSTETVSLTFLELLGVHGTLSHLSQYTSSACSQKLVADGSAAVYVSSSSNATAHALQFTSDVDGVFVSSYGKGQ